MDRSKVIQAAPCDRPVKRGRKPGFSMHPGDDRLLLQAARFVNTGHAASVRQAFLRLTKDDEHAVRRLQRRWMQVGDELLRRDRVAHWERCEIEYRGLRSEFPKFWARIAQFVASPTGKRHLKKFQRADGHPTHPMALGLDNLLNAIDQHEKASTTGEAKSGGAHPHRDLAFDPFSNTQNNQRRFDRAIEAWLDNGVAVTPETLRELSRRVNALADNLEADLKEETKE